jgi:hypothetical protein
MGEKWATLPPADVHLQKGQHCHLLMCICKKAIRSESLLANCFRELLYICEERRRFCCIILYSVSKR